MAKTLTLKVNLSRKEVLAYIKDINVMVSYLEHEEDADIEECLNNALDIIYHSNFKYNIKTSRNGKYYIEF